MLQVPTNQLARSSTTDVARIEAAARGTGHGKLQTSIVFLCVVAALAAIGPIYRATFLAEIDTNEGWIAYHVDAILKGLPLYPSPHQLVTNNYPPLFYYISASIAQLTGDVLFTGRVLSFIALLLVSLAIFLALRLLSAQRLSAFVAAVAYFATMCRLFDGKVGVNDPQLLAHAVMMLGFCAFLHARNAGSRWFVGPAMLMVAAGFIKHNLFAVPLASVLILAGEDRKAAMRFAVLGAALALSGIAVCMAVYGSDFAFNLFGPRPYHWARGFKALEDLHRVPVQFFLWIWFAFTVKSGDRGRIVNILCAVSLLESFIVRGGDEVDKNAGFDFVIAVNLALGLVLEHAADVRVPRLGTIDLATGAIAVMTARLLFGEPMDSFNILYGPGMARWYSEAEKATSEDATCIARISGPVACESPLLCYLAGKPFTVDPVNLEFRIGTGRTAPDVLDRRLEAGSLTYVPDVIGLRPYGPDLRNYFRRLSAAFGPVGRYLSPPSASIFSDIGHVPESACRSASAPK